MPLSQNSQINPRIVICFGIFADFFFKGHKLGKGTRGNHTYIHTYYTELLNLLNDQYSKIKYKAIGHTNVLRVFQRKCVLSMERKCVIEGNEFQI